MGALIRYKSFDSYIINNTLRNTKDVKKVDAEQQQFIKMKDSALSKMPKYKGNLFKTVDFSDWPDTKQQTDKFVDEFVIGELYNVLQYWRTSTKQGYNDNANVILYIIDSK